MAGARQASRDTVDFGGEGRQFMTPAELMRFRRLAWPALLTLALAACSPNLTHSPADQTTADTATSDTKQPDSAASTDTAQGETLSTAPLGQFSPALLDFGPVDFGKCAVKTVALSNWGTAPLTVQGLDLTGLDTQFTAEWLSPAAVVGQAKKGGGQWLLPAPLVLPSSQSASLSLEFCPTKAGPLAAKVPLLSDGGPLALEVKATGVKSTAPCVGLAKWSDPQVSQFGGVLPGKTEVRTPAIKNCGIGALSIVAVQLVQTPGAAEAEFALDWSEQLWGSKVGPGAISTANPLIIQPNGEAVFEVRYKPVDFGTQTDPDKAKLVITLSDGQQLEKDFTGWGVAEVCPMPAIEVLEGEEVVPGTTLHFSGTGSYSPKGGKITNYQWTIKQPPASNQSLFPSNSAPTTTLQANLAGEYEVCLDVWDDLGVKSCAPKCIALLVLSPSAIHIELLWDTPGDLDQTDSGPAAGADLDLHFAHPLAVGIDDDCDGKGDPWYMNTFDAFWFNATPNWGDANSTLDDPSFSGDDWSGVGPESTNLAAPAGTAADPVAYSIGVHYWNDHGYGASYATLSAYVYGGLAFQLAKVKLQPLDMWYVGKLHWSNGASGGPNVLIETCYQSGNSCKAGKNLMWQPKGDYCITPCYESKSFLTGIGSAAPGQCKP